MFETFRSIRFHLLLAALGYIAVGAVMLFIPDQFLAVVCYVIGALLIAYGVIGMLMCWKNRTIRMAKIFIGILAIAVGIFVIAQPKAFTAVLPIIFGLILLLDGILNLRHGIGLKKFGDPGFLSVIIVGVITVVLGAIVLIHPYGTAKFTLRIIGVALIYSGISDFLDRKRFSLTHFDIFLDRVRKKEYILHNNGNIASDLFQFQILHIDMIDGYASFVRIVKTL